MRFVSPARQSGGGGRRSGCMGFAPFPGSHKPLFPLVVLEMAEQGHRPAALLPLSPELAFRFFTYWNIVAGRRTQRPDVRLPFYHLQSDGFWEALDETGKPAAAVRLACAVRLDPEFAALAGDPSFR